MKKLASLVIVAVLLFGAGVFGMARWLDAPVPEVPVAAVVVSAPLLPQESPTAQREPVATAAPAAEPPPPAVVQLLRCVDEQGQAVADAEVRLVQMPWGSVADRKGRTDNEGRVTFADIVPATYAIRARQGLRHHLPHVPDINHATVTLPCPLFDVTLRELWIGGLVMPGAEIVSSGYGFGGFTWSNNSLGNAMDPKVEDEIASAWGAKHPGGLFLVGFQDPRRSLTDTIKVHVQWFGHQQHEQELRMWRASQFPGPEILDARDVPTCDWASPRVVLVGVDGTPLPDALQVALRATAGLHGKVLQRWSSPGGYTFRDGRTKLPVGDYELRLYDASTSQLTSVAKCNVARDTIELRLPVPTRDRVVRLHVRGIPPGGHMLLIAHESGRKALELVPPMDGDHTLLLPPGPCTATLKRQPSENLQETLEHGFTITEAIEQDVTWDVTGAVWTVNRLSAPR